MRHWYLDEKGEAHPWMPDDDHVGWSKWLGSADRRVALDVIDVDGEEVKVSTVFLGVDHNFGVGDPEIFETMIFGGEYDQHCTRYSTHIGAKSGHEDAVSQLLGGTFCGF